MFKNQSLFVLVEAEGGANNIQRIETTKDTQDDICELFGSAVNSFLCNKEYIEFNGSYKPDQNELLMIRSFEIDKEIIEAVKNPVSVEAFSPNSYEQPVIRALFMGCCNKRKNKASYVIGFQKFRKEQYISRRGLNLFHDSNTFTQDKRFGICISDTVDCVLADNELKFNSFYFARQIFDLSEYYREATDSDVEAFMAHSKIDVENTAVFKANADSWVRRKVALISDSDIFTKFSPKQIKEKAKDFGLNVNIKKNKLSLPSDKKELKNILKFLDEEIYKGIFTEQILQTNSKRKAVL
ncbi:MAG: Kiwa anti-phage protein KwaB-like domain-containing protein [Bacillota bacterium]